MTNRALWLLPLLVIAGCAAEDHQAIRDPEPAIARTAPAVPGGIEAALYPPELVIAHARELALDDAEVGAIRDDMRATQAALTALEPRLRASTEALAAALAQARVDEEAALAVATDVTAVESEIKLVHLRLLVRVRNRLSEAQRRQLDARRG